MSVWGLTLGRTPLISQPNTRCSVISERRYGSFWLAFMRAHSARNKPLRSTGRRHHSGWAINNNRVCAVLDRKRDVGFADGDPVHLAAMGALNPQALLPGSRKTLWARLYAGRSSSMRNGACEEKRGHITHLDVHVPENVRTFPKFPLAGGGDRQPRRSSDHEEAVPAQQAAWDREPYWGSREFGRLSCRLKGDVLRQGLGARQRVDASWLAVRLRVGRSSGQKLVAARKSGRGRPKAVKNAPGSLCTGKVTELAWEDANRENHHGCRMYA